MKEVSAFAEVMVYQVDMLEEEQVECMVQAAVAEWGRVDYAVNAAGTRSNNHSLTQSPIEVCVWRKSTRSEEKVMILVLI